MAVEQRLYTVEEYLQIAGSAEYADKRIELIDGEIVEMPGSSYPNSRIAGMVIFFLIAYVREHDNGYVSVPDGMYRLDDHTVLQPDAAFMSKERGKDPSEIVMDGSPDLAVEVISPSESHPSVIHKARRYLDAGTSLVWAVYPTDKTVVVYRLTTEGDLHTDTLGINDVLEGTHTMPGFTLPVKDIFPE